MQYINDDFITKLGVAVTPHNTGLNLGHTQIVMYKQLVIDVAKDMLAKNQENDDIKKDLNVEGWEILDCRDSEAFFYYPKAKGTDYIITHPFAHKCIDDPEEANYAVSGKLLGLIASMVALKRMQFEMQMGIKERLNNQSRLSKVLGRRDVKAEECVTRIAYFRYLLQIAVSKSFDKIKEDPTKTKEDLVANESSRNALDVLVENID